MLEQPEEQSLSIPEPGDTHPTHLTVDAVYRDGAIIPLIPLQLPPGTPISLQLAVRVNVVPTHQPEPNPVFVPQLEQETVDAIYQDGALRPLAALALPQNAPIRLYIALRVSVMATLRVDGESTYQAPPARLDAGAVQALPASSTYPPAADPAQGVAADTPAIKSTPPVRAGWQPDWQALRLRLAMPVSQKGILAALTGTDALLLCMGMLIYGIVRLVGLAAFPIYFFCDEAIQVNLAEELVRQGMKIDNVWLPPYFRNVEKWSLSLTVYIQAFSLMLFGKSVVITRATSAVVSMLAGVAVALTLKLVFKQRLWWSGALVLSALPVWFLHSRTAFETVMMVAFYACFLCTYLLYRYRNPRWIIAAIVFGGATFYSYTNGQGVMLVSGVLLLLSDIRYHIQMVRERWKLMLAAVGTLLLTSAQYLRFRYTLPEAFAEHLQVMNSVWLGDAPLSEKIATFGGNYLEGLSPFYWFSPINGADLDRHLIKGAGNLPLLFLPLLLVGLWVCIRQWRSPAHRAVLIAVLAAPFAASLVFIHNYRALAMVIPATLLICIGIERVFSGLLARGVRAMPLAVGCAVILAVMNFNLLRVSLTDGPTWYRDYGLYGMQYGATQVFPAIAEELDKSSDTRVFVSHSWANNPPAFVPFFLNDPQRGRVEFTAVEDYLNTKRDITPNQLFVMVAPEYDKAVSSGKLVLDTPIRVLPYPDGTPGFYFVHMRYVDTIDTILAAEREARRQLVETDLTLDGQVVRVRHSQTDLGEIAELFDGNRDTLVRGLEANPMVYEFEFPEPRTITGLGLDIWPMNLEMTIVATPADGSAPQTFTQGYPNLLGEPHIDYMLPDGPIHVRKLRIELFNPTAGEITKVHVPGIELR